MNSSSIAWLDFSDSERRKMMEIVSLFKDNETRDELGLGSVRDGFADLLFPGTSTIQTRVHYFLFVPWIYKLLEDKRISGRTFADALRREETSLIKALKEGGETLGVIGQRVGASLNRFPSSIYWNGLKQWGILHFPGSQYEYHRSLDSYYRRLDRKPDKESTELVENLSNWSLLPPIPQGFPYRAAFRLNKEQAEFLQTRILQSWGDSLLAYLVGFCQPVDEVAFAWFHPQIADFPERLTTVLGHARNFSEALHGAALLYNLMLAEESDNAEKVDEYQSRLIAWREVLLEREAVWNEWDRAAFWGCLPPTVRVPVFTERFVNNWLGHLFAGAKVANPIHSPELREIVRGREVRLKGARSRFQSRRHLEIWSGESGTAQLDFRWRIARNHTNDILEGLEANGEDVISK